MKGVCVLTKAMICFGACLQVSKPSSVGLLGTAPRMGQITGRRVCIFDAHMLCNSPSMLQRNSPQAGEDFPAPQQVVALLVVVLPEH